MDIVLRFLVLQMLQLVMETTGAALAGVEPIDVTTMQEKTSIYSVAYNLFHG